MQLLIWSPHCAAQSGVLFTRLPNCSCSHPAHLLLDELLPCCARGCRLLIQCQDENSKRLICRKPAVILASSSCLCLQLLQ